MLSVAVAAFFILVQRDIKRLLAYSSVENMGLVAVALGIGGPLGIFAALLHILNHSLAKTLLFCGSGNVLLKYGTRDLNFVCGMLKIMPFTAAKQHGGKWHDFLPSGTASVSRNTVNVNSSSNRGEAILAALKTQFPGAVLDEERQTPEQVTITVKINLLPDVVHYLYYQHDGWLPVLFGNDERTLNGHYAVYYALSMEGAEKCWIVVKALVDADSREFPSVTPRVPAAVWGEREIRDMYGLIPVGLPDQRRLVLPDDWPEDMHPLRKDAMDYRLRPEPTTDSETYAFINEGNSDARVIPVGPLHITSDEPGHFRLFVDGEQIVDADYRLFYVHRGMEKLAETRMGYNEVTFLSDRVCGICGFAHSVAYTNSVENALGIEVPQRAHTIRSILLEVERLHSHLLNLGLSCHFVGFDTGFMQFFRVREKSMTMAELLIGSRKTYGLNLIGGVRRDILKEQRLQTLKLVREMRADVSELVEMLLATPNMEQRTQGIGILDRQIARDLRFDHPYADYGNIPKHCLPLPAAMFSPA